MFTVFSVKVETWVQNIFFFLLKWIVDHQTKPINYHKLVYETSQTQLRNVFLFKNMQILIIICSWFSTNFNSQSTVELMNANEIDLIDLI